MRPAGIRRSWRKPLHRRTIPICRGDACRDSGYPQVFVNAADLTLFIRVTDLVFGGPAPAFSFERSYNMGDTHAGPFGAGWSFSLGDSLTTDTDDSLVLRRGSGRIDRFAPAVPSGPPSASSSAFFAVTSTTDTLAQNERRHLHPAQPGLHHHAGFQPRWTAAGHPGLRRYPRFAELRFLQPADRR